MSWFSGCRWFYFFDARSFWSQDLLFLPWCKKRSKRRSRHQGCHPNCGLSAILNVPGQTSPPSEEDLSFFCFFSFLKERKEGLIKKIFLASGSSFLLLIEEKKQKKIKASRMPAKLVTFNYSRGTRPNFLALGRGPFLILMQEKKQKKIKASGTPAKFDLVRVSWSEFLIKLAFAPIGK